MSCMCCSLFDVYSESTNINYQEFQSLYSYMTPRERSIYISLNSLIMYYTSVCDIIPANWR